jgi:hypothetical protein
MGRTCRLCGCTDRRACVTAGIPCHWVAAEVCSACVQIPAELAARFADLDRRLNAAFAPVARFWSDEYGCSRARADQIEDEAYGADFEEWRAQRWPALRALWIAPAVVDKRSKTGQLDDLAAASPGRKAGLRSLCTLAILFNRRGGVSYSRALSMAFWDLRSDGYGWGDWELNFDPLLLRYAVEQDGDSLY